MANTVQISIQYSMTNIQCSMYVLLLKDIIMARKLYYEL